MVFSTCVRSFCLDLQWFGLSYSWVFRTSFGLSYDSRAFEVFAGLGLFSGFGWEPLPCFVVGFALGF